MFNVDTEGKTITLSRGDTGAVRITATTNGYTFAADDRAVFTVRSAGGAIVRERYYAITDGSFDVVFLNSDTDTLAIGTYSWDVRYVLNPYYDGNGRIVDGDQVITPELPMQIQLLNVVGEV